MKAFDHPQIVVSLDSLGEIRLRILIADDMQYLFDTVARKHLTDKEFIQAILFHQLASPEIAKEAFERISDEDLKKLAATFIENENYTFREYKDTGNVFADFRRPITQYVEAEEKRFQEQYGPAIKQAEKLTESLHRSGLLNALKSTDAINNTTSGISAQLTAALDTITSLNLPYSDILAGNSGAIELVRNYWRGYYAFNETITNNVFSAITTQTILPQKNHAADLQIASSLSARNAELFVEKINEVNAYPEVQRNVLCERIGLKSFSIAELEAIMEKMRKITERDSQLMFWESRIKGRLMRNPERIAQGYTTGLLHMGLPDGVFVIPHPCSGSGIIDITLTFLNEYGERQVVILELKVFEENHSLNDGIEQTAQYMLHEETDYGYRVIFNATNEVLQRENRVASNGKIIKDVIININLPNPSSLD